MKGFVATIGMFDGVHLGHQFVLRQVVQTAAARGLQTMAITFDHSLRPEHVLTPLAAKQALLSKAGINRVEVLSFTDELRRMTAREFMRQVLKERLNVKVLLTGYDNRFGYNREEGFDDYVRYGQELGIEVLQLPAEGDISSSHIRRLLTDGCVAEATKCLGHPYIIQGRVIHGEHIGTNLGYPTANLLPDDDYQLIPATGVYAVRVTLRSSLHTLNGMMNIGTRPTFDGSEQTLEVHILHFNHDIYGQPISVEFVSRLREERRFESMEALKEQLNQDAIQAEQVIKESSR